MLAASILLLTMLTVTGILVGALLLPVVESRWPPQVLVAPRASSPVGGPAPPASRERSHRSGLALVGGRAARCTGVRQRRAAGRAVGGAGLGAPGCSPADPDDRLRAASTCSTPRPRSEASAWRGPQGWPFIPAPAGAGVREGVLVLTLGPVVGGGAAVTVALASRVLLVLTDIALAATSVGLRTLRGVRDARAERSARGTAGSASAHANTRSSRPERVIASRYRRRRLLSNTTSPSTASLPTAAARQASRARPSMTTRSNDPGTSSMAAT